ncbi:hypothetical protein HDU99_010121 [Rhizoclosmatium hyalinum]|nr:hypothetical protein HDU99_010121 [Rhizoclosmatium hyalinum]
MNAFALLAALIATVSALPQNYDAATVAAAPAVATGYAAAAPVAPVSVKPATNLYSGAPEVAAFSAAAAVAALFAF